jgi:hypothetical protein
MRWPGPEIEQNERPLDAADIAASECTSPVRSIASTYEGIVMGSERVTLSDEFGYIYRYGIVKYMADDGQFHPELGTKGQVFRIETKLVVHGHDRNSLSLVTIPMFELPKAGARP